MATVLRTIPFTRLLGFYSVLLQPTYLLRIFLWTEVGTRIRVFPFQFLLIAYVDP
jgi:hypothetical protein